MRKIYAATAFFIPLILSVVLYIEVSATLLDYNLIQSYSYMVKYLLIHNHMNEAYLITQNQMMLALKAIYIVKISVIVLMSVSLVKFMQIIICLRLPDSSTARYFKPTASAFYLFSIFLMSPVCCYLFNEICWKY